MTISAGELRKSQAGLVTGALAGALIGAAGWFLMYGGINFLVSSLWKGMMGVIQKLLLAWHTKTYVAALAGFLVGFTLGFCDPDLVILLATALTAALTFTTESLTFGLGLKTLGDPTVLRQLTPSLKQHFISIHRFVTAGGFILLGFTSGVLVGYIAGSATRVILDKYDLTPSFFRKLTS